MSIEQSFSLEQNCVMGNSDVLLNCLEEKVPLYGTVLKSMSGLLSMFAMMLRVGGEGVQELVTS